MSKLRLLLWEECNRTCAGCCNKDWNLSELPVCFDYSGYDLILIRKLPTRHIRQRSGIPCAEKSSLSVPETAGWIVMPS